MTDHFLANAGLIVFQPVSVLPSNKLVDGFGVSALRPRVDSARTRMVMSFMINKKGVIRRRNQRPRGARAVAERGRRL